MKNKLLYTTLVILLLVLSGQSFSAIDSGGITEQLHQLDDNDFESPNSRLNKASQLLNWSKTNNDLVNELWAAVLVIEAKLALERINESKDSIEQYLKSAFEIDHKEFQARLLMASLAVADAENDRENSKALHLQLREYLQLNLRSKIVATIHMQLGYSNYLNNNNALAVEYFEKAFNIFEKLDHKYGLSSVYNALANVYSADGDKDLALAYFNKSLEISISFDDDLTASVLYYNIALTYSAMKRYDLAVESLLNSMQLSRKLEDVLGLAYSQNSLAYIYIEQKRFAEADELLQSSARVFKSQGEMGMYFDTLLSLLDSSISQHNVELANVYYDQAKPLADTYESQQYPSFFLKLTAGLYALKGEYEQAYQLQRDYNDALAEFNEVQRSKRVDELLIQFDSKAKAVENDLLSKENELHELKLEQQSNRTLFWLLVSLMAVVAVFVTAYLLYIQVQHRNRYQRMALRDHLTNAPNRRAILQYANERYEEAKQTGMTLTLALIDLDYFKKFNDRYGHEVGDEVLISFALSCKKVLRKQDRYGRYGGEEWLLVLSDTNKDEVAEIFTRLRLQYNREPIEGVPEDTELCFSMGVAQYDKTIDHSLQSMINRADVNLYKAKAQGRDQLVQ